MRDYKKHIFREFVSFSALDTIRTAGYPIFLLDHQHRAVDGQFTPVYQNFYPEFDVKHPHTQHPSNHPDAQRVEDTFVADFPALQPSPADQIVPIFINVPNCTIEYVGTSRHSLKQTKAASYIVDKLILLGIKPVDIMVIGAYRAEIFELRKVLERDVLVTTADAVQRQERDYVVFVFATNNGTGSGFTMNPRRLCVSMSRQKKFLALVGDIDTVDHKTFKASPETEMLTSLVNIHRYFVANNRVCDYDGTQADPQGAAGTPAPSTTNAHDERRKELWAQIEALQADLKELDAQEFSKEGPSASTSSDPVGKAEQVPSETKTIAKLMTARERMKAMSHKFRVPVVEPSEASGSSSWGSSDNAGTAGNNAAPWGSSDNAGKSEDAWTAQSGGADKSWVV